MPKIMVKRSDNAPRIMVNGLPAPTPPVTALRAYLGRSSDNNSMTTWIGPLNPDGILNQYGKPVSGYIMYNSSKRYIITGFYYANETKTERSDALVQAYSEGKIQARSAGKLYFFNNGAGYLGDACYIEYTEQDL